MKPACTEFQWAASVSRRGKARTWRVSSQRETQLLGSISLKSLHTLNTVQGESPYLAETIIVSQKEKQGLGDGSVDKVLAEDPSLSL